MKTAIGIDIGGTKISLVLGTPEGAILSERRIPTLAGARTKADQGLAHLIAELDDLLREAKAKHLKPSGIGVGIPGPVDPAGGIIPRSPHLGGWEGRPLRKILEKRFNLPVYMNNDANAAVLGEKNFGAGRGLRDFIYMTVSTGIGGGIVIGGKLIEGSGFVAGEVGHMCIVPGGEPCKCGKKGCLEAYASGTALAHFAARELKRHGLSRMIRMMTGGGPISARILGAAARKGDPLAVKLYERAGAYLGVGIANLLNILNPQKIILGGGVFRSAPTHFWKAMRESAKREAWPQAWKTVEIVHSPLNGRVGDLGALALAFEKQG